MERLRDSLKSTKLTDQDRGRERQASATVEVLYQKLGARWFAFSCIENEVFVGSIDPEEVSPRDQTQHQNVHHSSG